MKFSLWPLAWAGVFLVLVVPEVWSDAGRSPGSYIVKSGSKLTLVRGPERIVIAPGFAAAADPDVSFDARKILFAGRENAASAWPKWRWPGCSKTKE